MTMLLACFEACSSILFRVTLPVFIARAQCLQIFFSGIPVEYEH